MDIRPSIINQIAEELDESKYLKVAIYGGNEVVFYIWEREVPISVNPKTGEILLDVEGYDWKLTHDMIDEISRVMEVIKNNMPEIRGWVRSWDDEDY
jgi:hypothetical protein